MDSLLQDAEALLPTSLESGSSPDTNSLQSLLGTFAVLIIAIGKAIPHGSPPLLLYNMLDSAFPRFLRCLRTALSAARLPTWRLTVLFDSVAVITAQIGNRSHEYSVQVVSALVSQFQVYPSGSYSEWWMVQLERVLVGLGDSVSTDVTLTIFNHEPSILSMRLSSNPRVVAVLLRICQYLLRQRSMDVVQLVVDALVTELVELSIQISTTGSTYSTGTIATFNFLALEALTESHQHSRIRYQLLRPNLVEFVTSDAMSAFLSENKASALGMLHFLQSYYTGQCKVGVIISWVYVDCFVACKWDVERQ